MADGSVGAGGASTNWPNGADEGGDHDGGSVVTPAGISHVIGNEEDKNPPLSASSLPPTVGFRELATAVVLAPSTIAASSVGDPDEYERVCGVCLDVGDFIVAKPCLHKICGVWGGGGDRVTTGRGLSSASGNVRLPAGHTCPNNFLSMSPVVLCKKIYFTGSVAVRKALVGK